MDNNELLRNIHMALKNNADSLDLNRGGITTLPIEIGQLGNLKRLFLNENDLTALPTEISQLVKLAGLYVRENKLTAIPAEIAKLTNLQWLIVSGNYLRTLPQEINQLVKLEGLNLSGNQLESLPSELGCLIRLRTLGLDKNQLTAIPAEIGRLVNLLELTVSNNRLTTVPAKIGLLMNLQTLDLSSNDLTALPPEIGLLSNLQSLNLSHNQLATLPKEIGQLTDLEVLDVSENQLTTLPAEIGLLTKLKTIVVRDNRLTTPPPEIVRQGTSAIIAYLREQVQDSRKQWISKLLVVGQGGVGKTSLLRSLREEPFDTQESTTHGIEIKSLLIKHPSENDVTMQLNTWDFGGQEIYHATHQFFLTNRSLFLLAWNARHGFEQGKLYYWLDTIKARAPESPVIIVATYIDERDADIPLADLQRKYPQIIAHCEMSNKTGLGVDKLRNVIAAAAAELPLMGETWPTNWLNAANAIRSMPENHITPRQLNGIMAERNVFGKNCDILAQWLHELGDILYFQDDPELNDTVILNPQWVTESISKVLESEQVINDLGLFTRDHMDELWSDIDRPMRDLFLRLMEKFDLSYQTLENKDISLIVERLNLNPPDYEQVWKQKTKEGNCNEISMKFVLDTTMPAGIPSWFIARSHRFTTRTHWRYGALFVDGPERRHLGLIQAFPHDRYLKLTVRGATPHNFFALLLDGLEITLKRFPGLQIDRRIPCPGHNGVACRHEFELANLQRAIERKPAIMEIQCPVAFEDISVPSLLVGLPWSMTNEVIVKQYKKIHSEIKELKEGVEDLGAFAQREFTQLLHREQERIESYCPNVFVLRPVQSESQFRKLLERMGILKVRSLFVQKMELQLYCQAPGQWHPTERNGTYIIEQPAAWLRIMAPYIKKMASILKYASPLIGPWVSALSPEQYKDLFQKDIRFMEDLVEKLPELAPVENRSDFLTKSEGSNVDRVEGAILRALYQVLREKDAGRHWGGLKSVLTPEGHYLWLCKHHSMEYTR